VAVSKTRLAVRFVLFLLLLGVIALGVVAWKNNQPDALWDRAQAAMKEQDNETAKLLLRNLLQKKPDHAEGHVALATVLRDEQKKDNPNVTFAQVPAAVEHLARAAELRPDDANILRPLLAAYEQLDRRKDALKTAELLHKVEPANADALFWLARDAIANRNDKTAKPLLERLRSLKGEPRPRTLRLLAEYYELTRQPKKRDAALVESLAAAGRLEHKVSLSDLAAVDALQLAAVKEAPTAAEADRRIALALQFQERRSKVARQPVEAAEATVKLVRAYLAGFPLKRNDPKREKTMKSVVARSIALVQAAAKSDRAAPLVHWELVRLILYSGDTAKAVATAEAALERLQKQKTRDENVELDLHLVAAEALYRQGRLKSALKHAEALIKDGKTERHLGAGHLIAGNIHADEGRHELALYHFHQAAKHGLAESLRVSVGLANSYAALGRWQEARPHLEAINLQVGDVKGADARWAKAVLGDGSRVRLRLAQAYLATGETQRAEQLLEPFQGTEHEPAALALRIIHAWQTDRAPARRRMDAARRKFPTNALLAYLDVRMHLAVNEVRQAEQVASQLAKARPMDVTAQMLMFEVLKQRRDDADAVKLLDDLIRRFPRQPRLILLKAQTLLDAGRNQEAMNAAGQLAKHPELKDQADFIAALAALRSQNLKDAADRLEAMQGGQRQVGRVDLLKGSLSLTQGRPDEAIRELTSALQYTRLRAVAGRSLLRSLLVLANQKSPREALAKVDGLLQRNPTQQSLLLAKTELQSRTGDYSGALATLKTLDSRDPNSSDGPYYLARFWLGMNQVPSAAREIARAVEIAPQSTQVRFLAASIALRAGRPDEAVAHADAGLKFAPRNAGLLLLKATALQRQKRSADAVALLQQFTKDSPNDIAAWLLLAGIRASENRPDDALQTLADGRAKNPADFSLARESIRLLVSRKKLAEADKLAASLAGDKPDFQTLFRLAVAFEAAGETARGRDWGHKALAAAKAGGKPSQIEAAQLKLAELAWAESSKPHADQKWLREARDRYEAVLKKHPRQLVAANNLAWLLAVRLNDPAGARKVIDPLAPDSRLDRLPASAIDTIVVVYRKQKDDVALEKLLKDAMRVQPGNPKWIRAYVDLALLRNRLDAAMSELSELQRRRGWWAEPPYGIARIYAAMGRPRDALSLLQRALTIAPSHREARLMAVNVAARLGDSQAVLRHADAALKQDPDQWQVYLRKVLALKALKRSDEATRFLNEGILRLREAVKSDRSAKLISHYIALSGLVQARDGDARALVVLRDALQAHPRDFALVRPALLLLLKAGKTADAMTLLDQHVAKDAPVARLVEVGNAYYGSGNYDAALEWGDKALARAADDEKPAAWMLAGNALLAKGKKTNDKALIEQARSKYEAVLKQAPNDFAAGNNLAWLLAAELNRPADALKIAERIRGDAPVERMNRSFIDTLSLVYRRAKEWKKARDLLQQATATFASHAPFHLQLGEVYIATNDPRAAQRALQRALELGLNKPDADRARRMLADLGKPADE
jgi:tetratricopeptide (TPR) repeat protein